MSTPPKLVCLDIDGTLTDGANGPALPGAIETVNALRRHVPVRFATNMTSISHAEITRWLVDIGIARDGSEIYTPTRTARQVLESRGQTRGIAIGRTSDLDWFQEDPEGTAVLLASEGHDLRIAELKPAFHALLRGATLYAMMVNRYYKKHGELVTDIGPLAAFLSYAATCETHNLGKPSPLLFDTIARDASLARDDLVMVGDDCEFDASGSVAIGVRGIAVRSGKYRPGDETRVDPKPTAVIDTLSELLAHLQLS
ncbi:MAG: HAD hydrolase-like protein [Planctomycetes bacterium]|nr:HAD hydrolase-like protein [Planctomycetota bacterium]